MLAEGTGAHYPMITFAIPALSDGFPEQIEELAHLTIAELRRAAEDMSPAEVARARAQMKAGLLMGLESPSARAERLARLVSIWGRVPDLAETVERIDAVTTGDVRALSGRLAIGSPAALALYGPADAAPSLEEIRARLAA